METLELAFEVDGARPGTDRCADNPLARATDCLFRQGRPFSRLSKCFFRGIDGRLRWLGIFVHSAGNRIIFFPGFAQLHKEVVGYRDDVLAWDRPFQIDHLSLESDWLDWHFTEPRSADHIGNFRTLPLGLGVVHWFSMSVQTQDDLRVLRRRTLVSAPTPARDVERRTEVFVRAREDAVFRIVELNRQHGHVPAPNFLHFSVVVGLAGFHSPEDGISGIPFDSPLARPAIDGSLAGMPIRIHRVALSGTIELEITASLLPGQLQNRFVFSGDHVHGQD